MLSLTWVGCDFKCSSCYFIVQRLFAPYACKDRPPVSRPTGRFGKRKALPPATFRTFRMYCLGRRDQVSRKSMTWSWFSC